MNQWQLNGQTLGSGDPDFRVFIRLSMVARATSTIVVKATRYMTSAVNPSATSDVPLSGVLAMASSVTARARPSVDIIKSNAVYVASAITAKASSACLFVARRYMTAFATPSASSIAYQWVGQRLVANVTAHAATYATIFETGFNAPSERTMQIATDNRSMKVT